MVWNCPDSRFCIDWSCGFFFLSLYGDSREKSSRSPILTFQTNKRSVQNLESFRPYLRLIATSSSCTSVTSTEEQSDVCDALSPFPLSGKPPFTGTGGILHSLKNSLLSRISTLFLTLLTLNDLTLQREFNFDNVYILHGAKLVWHTGHITE